jgi:hypothetical protein
MQFRSVISVQTKQKKKNRAVSDVHADPAVVDAIAVELSGSRSALPPLTVSACEGLIVALALAFVALTVRPTPPSLCTSSRQFVFWCIFRAKCCCLSFRWEGPNSQKNNRSDFTLLLLLMMVLLLLSVI